MIAINLKFYNNNNNNNNNIIIIIIIIIIIYIYIFYFFTIGSSDNILSQHINLCFTYIKWLYESSILIIIFCYS